MEKEGSLSSTVVPNRNGIFLMIAAGYASSIGASEVLYGAHHSDYGMYPDCRPEFVVKMNSLLFQSLGTDDVIVKAPLIHTSKEAVLELAQMYNVPLDLTWSCYNSGPVHCGECSSCIERRESFKAARITDPTEYIN